ncbi:hypothetical protein ACPBEI_04870 [Latilactobacillus sakei]
MLNKLKKFCTSSMACIVYKLSNIKLIGIVKLLWIKLGNYRIRIFRFFKRISLSTGSLTVTTIFLLLFYFIVQLWGFNNGKYVSWLDGLWDMKSIFITTIGIGLVSLSTNEQNNWQEKLKVQHGFRLSFTNEEYILHKIGITIFGNNLQALNDLNKNYVAINDTHLIIKDFNKSEFNSLLEELLKDSKDLLDKINFVELAVDSDAIQFDINLINSNIKEFLNKKKITDEDYLHIFNMINFYIRTIANRLSSPWRWDKVRDKKYFEIKDKYKLTK